MQDSILNEKQIMNIENYYLVDLKEENNLNTCIETIEKFLSNYNHDFIDNLKYNSIVKELFKVIEKDNNVDNNLIIDMAKKYNEENNKHLIIKKEKIKKGFLNWILKTFKINPQKEVSIDTKYYDKEEKRLINEFNEIWKKLNTYVNEFYILENIIVKERYDDIKSKVFSGVEINSNLIKLIEELKSYRKYLSFKEIEFNKEEPCIREESLEKIIFNCEEDSKDSIALEEILQSELKISKEKIFEEVVEDNITDENIINEEIRVIYKESEFKEIDENSVYKETTYKNELKENDKKNIHNKLLITEIFNDNIFKIFINYCNENNLETVDDLRGFDFNELNKLRGFGVGKKEKLIQKYLEVIGQDYIQESKNNEAIVDTIEFKIKDIYKNLDINILECFNKVNRKIIEQIKSTNINSIEELYKAIYNNTLYIPNLGATKIKYIKEALDNLEKNQEELFRFLMDEIKENPDYDILVKRVINNNTLQQIGEEYGLSRERIRQKEKKVIKSIEAVLDIFIRLENFTNTKILSIEEILGILLVNNEEKECLKYVLINLDDSKCKYIEEIDKFLVNGDIADIKSKIISISNGMPDIVSIKNELIYDLQEYIELNILSLDEVVNMILSLGYKKVNDFLFRGTVSKTKIYNFIVKEFFKNGITFSNDEDINKFNYILKEKFDIQDDSIRNIKAKIESSCVLCDRGSYIHSEWVDIDERLLNEVKEYIDNSSQETLYLNQIFVEFEKELNNVGIKNRYYLQGILKYYFSDNYNFTKDTLYKGDIRHNRNYIFNKYIEDKGRAVTKEDIENDLKGWTPIMITMAEDECKCVLKWDKGGFIHSTLIKTSLEEVKQISKVISKLFSIDKESITDNEAFYELKKSFEDFFKENQINSSFKLFSVLEYLLSKEYYFRRPYILKDKPTEAISATYLMKKLFNNDSKVTLEQLKEFCNNIKLNDSTRMQSINSLLKDTVEIEKETYILKENFDIDESVVETVKEIILDKISENGYIALKSLDDYSIFPSIKYEWNTYILRDICEYYIPEVKELKRQFYDKRYPAPVIVAESSEMNKLLDLIIIILKSEFESRVEVNELSNYLRKNNIVYDRIPFEIYNSDEIVVEDNIVILK